MVAKGIQLKEYKCKHCGETDPEKFYNKTNMKSCCSKCHNIRAHQVQRELKIRAIDYMGNSCYFCKNVFDSPSVYDFHHLDPSEKEFNWGNKRTSNWENLKKELDKCVLTCSNCHRIEHDRQWFENLPDSHPEKIRRLNG